MRKAEVLESGPSENGVSDKLDIGKAKGKEARIEVFSVAGHKIIRSVQGDKDHSFVTPLIFIGRTLSARHFSKH